MRTAAHAAPRVGLLAVAAAALLCLLLGPLALRARAGPAWLGALDLSASGQNAEAPQIALDSAGDATALWTRSNGTNTIIQSAFKPAGGPWQGPIDLSATGQNASEPQLAVDPAGDAVAIWRRYDGSNYIAQAASKPVGGAWLAPLDLSAAGQSASEPQIALDSAGDATALWTRSNGTNTIIQSATALSGAAWSAPIDLSAPGQNAEAPRLAVDVAGYASSIWARSNGANTIVQNASKSAAGAWSAPLDLSAAGQSASEPQIALDSAGDATALWARSNGTNTIIQSATAPAGAAWSAPIDLSTVGRSASEPRLTVDAEGNAVAIWSHYDGAHTIVQSAAYDASGPRLRSFSVPAAGTVRMPLSFSVSPFDVWSALGAITWSFGDGATASGAAVTHGYVAPGVYPVTVRASDSLANATTASATVAIFAKASAAHTARVSHGSALLKLHCPSTAACRGEVELICGVTLRRHHHRFGMRLPIGRAAFTIPPKRTTTVPVRISARGKALVARAGRKGLKAQLTGTGVKHRLVLLLGGANDGGRHSRVMLSPRRSRRKW
jgi:PKD domain